MVEYYVDSRADHGGDGTEVNPWTNLTQAANSISSGDVVNVVPQSGPYSGSLDIATANTIWNFNGNTLLGCFDLNKFVNDNSEYYSWKESVTPGMGYYLSLTGRSMNLLQNWRMDKTGDWSILSGATLSVSHNYHVEGNGCFKVVSDADGSSIYQSKNSLTTDASYKVSGYYKPSETGITIRIFVRDVGLDYADTIVVDTTSTGTEWVYFEDTITLPVNDDYYVMVYVGGNTKTVYFDSFGLFNLSASGEQEAIPEIRGTASDITFGVVDGYWWAASHALSGGNPPPPGQNNWDYSDQDSLGFNSFYAFLDGGIDPTNTGKEILINNVKDLINITVDKVIINDAILIGAQQNLIRASMPFDICRSVLMYTDENGINYTHSGSADESSVVFCQFYDTGHRSLAISADNSTYNFYHNTFVGSHLILVNSGQDNITVNFKNNNSNRLVAGAIRWDDCPNASLNESNNQFKVDEDSHHAIALRHQSGTVAYWLETDPTDLPPSADTTVSCPTACGVDGGFISATRGMNSARILGTSVCKDAGIIIAGVNDIGQLDPWGSVSGPTPNIGTDQSSNQNFISVDSGFDPNAITQVDIYG